MTSSYTSNLGIQKPATGDQSGTWGDTVNVNMDIVDRAINGVGAISLSGTTHTLTTTDGTLSEGMYKVLVLGGSPSGTNTITISPNDQDKLYFVYNNSGQSAIFSQGSGANVTVANGDTKLIYADGAGAGAAVSDFTANLAMSSVNITGGTIGGANIVVSSGDSITTDTIAETTAAAGVTIDGVLVKDGEVDGRDVSVDGTKLDTVETNADVTDTTNVTAAGALMDSELTNITAVKALDQGVATTDSPSFAGLTATTADINGGTIDGAVIGGASAAAGTFTTLRANTSLGVNGAGVSNVAAAISGADRPLASDDTANLVVYSTTTPATDVGGSIGFGHSSHGGALLGVIKGMKASSGTNIGEMAFALRSDAAYSTEVARLTSAQFGMANAAGPALLNEAATSTNPSVVSNRADPDTELGWVSANVGALIAGGTKNISWDNTHVGLNGMTPNAPAQGNFSVTMGGIGSTGSGLLQIVGNAAGAYRNAGVHFVGYDGGSYSENAVIEQHYTTGTASGSLVFKTKAQAGSLTTVLTLGDEQTAIFTGNVALSNVAGPALLNEAATSTNPTLVPNRADPDTGMGWVSANIVRWLLVVLRPFIGRAMAVSA
jgi:hypothetical protein